MRDWTLFWSFNSGPHSWQDATKEIFCFHQIFQTKTFILKMEIIWWECIHFLLLRLFAIILYMCNIATYMWPTINSTEYTAGNPIFKKLFKLKDCFVAMASWIRIWIKVCNAAFLIWKKNDLTEKVSIFRERQLKCNMMRHKELISACVPCCAVVVLGNNCQDFLFVLINEMGSLSV